MSTSLDGKKRNQKLAVPGSLCQLLNLSEEIQRRPCEFFQDRRGKGNQTFKGSTLLRKKKGGEGGSKIKPMELTLVWPKNKLPF